MGKIAQYLTKKLIENGIIEAESQEIYTYGIELMLSSLLVTVCVGFLGIIFRRVILAVIYLVALAHLRHYAGGYHADSYKKCFILSCSLFVFSMVIIFLQKTCQLRISLIIGSLVATLYLFNVGSLNSEKNPKTDEEICYRKRRTRQFTVTYSIIVIFVFLFMDKYWDIATMIVCTQIYTALSVWVIQCRKGNAYEKTHLKRNC